MADNEYYDEVDEEAYEQSRQNVSEPDPRSRDLWQSTTISTDDKGPTVDQVAPVFAQARADALANPVLPDGDEDEEAKAVTADQAEAAQEEADAIRDANGYVAPTGADAGIYDDPKHEDLIPSENFSAAPESDDDEERNADEVAAEERNQTAGAQNAHTDEVDQQHKPQAEQDASPTGEQTSTDDLKDADKDTTHDDLVSDTAGEQGGLDETSATGATPKRAPAKRNVAAKKATDSK